jgi:hypothetical protein
MWYLGERGRNRDGPPRPIGTLGTELGVDNGDPAVARALVNRGAEVIVSSTHDWPQLAVQQLAFARLWSRALGVPIVRADWRYESAILDRGRVLAHARSGRTVLTAAVAEPRWTPYRSVGDWPGWAALAAAVAAVQVVVAEGKGVESNLFRGPGHGQVLGPGDPALDLRNLHADAERSGHGGSLGAHRPGQQFRSGSR